MEANAKKDPVAGAVTGVKRATAALIRLVASRDERVSLDAREALLAMDPPPIGALAEALLRGKDRRVRAGVAGVVGATADADKLRALTILGFAFRAERDAAVRQAIVDAMLGMTTYFEDLARDATAPGDGRHA